ncbi:MAG TPA: hypothetical protein VEC56_00040 [Candidatus Krumholzibacteria bacterium]|nr:hypothetical protein [Candidatus Krumholzibacteria bacterium]
MVLSEFQDCYIVDDAPRLHTLTLMHRFNTGSIAARFKLEANAGMAMTYVSETHAWPSLGNMRTGISVCYGSCQAGDTVLGTVTYQGYGMSHSCAQFIVVPHPDAEALDVVTCGNEPELVTTFHFEVFEGPGGGCSLCINHDPGIQYGGDPELFDCQPVSSNSSTWGAIKALYR